MLRYHFPLKNCSLPPLFARTSTLIEKDCISKKLFTRGDSHVKNCYIEKTFPTLVWCKHVQQLHHQRRILAHCATAEHVYAVTPHDNWKHFLEYSLDCRLNLKDR